MDSLRTQIQRQIDDAIRAEIRRPVLDDQRALEDAFVLSGNPLTARDRLALDLHRQLERHLETQEILSSLIPLEAIR